MAGPLLSRPLFGLLSANAITLTNLNAAYDYGAQHQHVIVAFLGVCRA